MSNKGKKYLTGPFRRRVFAAVVAISMTATLGACASDSSAQAGEELEVVNVGLIPNLALYLPMWVAQDKGFFEEEGVELKTTTVRGGGSETLAALTGGSFDMTDLSFQAVATANEKGLPLKFVAGNYTSMPYSILIRNGQDDIKQGTGFPEVIHSLRGKKIGVTSIGSSSYLTLKHLLAEAGMNEGDVEIIQAGTQMAPQMVSDQLDAAMANEPDTTMLSETMDAGYIGLDLRDEAVMKQADLEGFIYDGWVAKAEVADEERIKNAATAMKRGIELVKDESTDQGYLVDLTKKNLDLDADDEVIAKMIANMRSGYNIDIPEEKVSKAFELYGLTVQPYQDIVSGVAAEPNPK